jgi:hypothetical protein
MKTPNEILIDNLKKNPKFKDLKTDKPKYEEGYWDVVEDYLKKNSSLVESNNITK